jgi:hypothetical protein
MDHAHPESPDPVYRGLDRCDLCGGPLARGEALAGICTACRGSETPRGKDGS